jgi:hypothetical protein
MKYYNSLGMKIIGDEQGRSRSIDACTDIAPPNTPAATAGTGVLPMD